MKDTLLQDISKKVCPQVWTHLALLFLLCMQCFKVQQWNSTLFTAINHAHIQIQALHEFISVIKHTGYTDHMITAMHFMLKAHHHQHGGILKNLLLQFWRKNLNAFKQHFFVATIFWWWFDSFYLDCDTIALNPGKLDWSAWIELLRFKGVLGLLWISISSTEIWILVWILDRGSTFVPPQQWLKVKKWLLCLYRLKKYKKRYWTEKN